MEQRLFLNERKSETNDPQRMRVRLTRTRLAPFSFDRGILIRAIYFDSAFISHFALYSDYTRFPGFDFLSLPLPLCLSVARPERKEIKERLIVLLSRLIIADTRAGRSSESRESAAIARLIGDDLEMTVLDPSIDFLSGALLSRGSAMNNQDRCGRIAQ